MFPHPRWGTSPGLSGNRETISGAQPERHFKLGAILQHCEDSRLCQAAGVMLTPPIPAKDAPMSKIRTLGLLLTATLAVAACSQKSADQAAPAADPAPAAPATPPPAPTAPTLSGVARQKAPDGTAVSFVGIKNGDTVVS